MHIGAYAVANLHASGVDVRLVHAGGPDEAAQVAGNQGYALTIVRSDRLIEYVVCLSAQDEAPGSFRHVRQVAGTAGQARFLAWFVDPGFPKVHWAHELIPSLGPHA